MAAIRALSVVLGAVAVVTSCTEDDPPASGEVKLENALSTLDCVASDRFEELPTFECTVDDARVLMHVPNAANHQQFVEFLEGRYAPMEFFPCPGEPFPDGFRVVDGEEWVVVTATPGAAAEVVRHLGGVVQPTPHGGGPPYSYPHPALDCDV